MQRKLDQYLEDPPSGYPWGRWRRDGLCARAYLESKELESTVVEMVAEIQVMLAEYLEGRKASHLIYKAPSRWRGYQSGNEAVKRERRHAGV